MSSGANRRPSSSIAVSMRALEVVLVAAGVQVRDQGGLVLAGDVVDADGLAESADHRLGQLTDVAVAVEGVLDLLVGHGRGVDADEALVGAGPGS